MSDIEWLIGKQAAKRPVNVRKSKSGNIQEAQCPSCGYDFPDIGGLNECLYEVEKFPYCPYCGQSIDWGEPPKHDWAWVDEQMEKIRKENFSCLTNDDLTKKGHA